MSSEIILGALTTIGGIVTTYLTVKYKHNKTADPEKKPKDRMEQMFDGYERLIKAKDHEAERLQKSVTSLEQTVHRLEYQLASTKELLELAKDELEESRNENEALKQTLQDFKNEYRLNKREDERDLHKKQ